MKVHVTKVLFRRTVISCFATLVSHADVVGAASPLTDLLRGVQQSVSHPLPPEYGIDPNTGSITLRICFNWSCSRREIITITPSDVDLLKRRLATCSGTSLHNRLQRVRIGIWQMELLAQQYQPLLGNDLAINDFDAARGSGLSPPLISPHLVLKTP